MDDKERVDGVGVLRDNCPLFAYGEGYDLGISGAVPLRQVKRVERIVLCFPQAVTQPAGELGVNQELHRPRSITPLSTPYV